MCRVVEGDRPGVIEAEKIKDVKPPPAF